ncbi:hypothetical protein Tco_1304718 [Tanacetum coccineum]
MKPATKLRKLNFDCGVKECVSKIMTVVDVLMTPPFAPRLSGIAQTCPGFIGTPGHVSAIPLSQNAEGGVMSTSTAVTIPETHTLTP